MVGRIKIDNLCFSRTAVNTPQYTVQSEIISKFTTDDYNWTALRNGMT